MHNYMVFIVIFIPTVAVGQARLYAIAEGVEYILVI